MSSRAGSPCHGGGRVIVATLWAIVGVACALPLGWLVWQVATRPDLLGDLRPTAFRLALLGRTIGYNLAAAVLAVLMALPAAQVIGRGRGWGAVAVACAAPLGLLMPSLAFTYGWVQALRLAGLVFEPQSWGDLARCVWTLAAWLWGLPAVAIGLSLRATDAQVQQQALLDGALWRVTARQLAGPAVAALALVLVLATQEFAVYERGGISVVATEVRTVFETGAFSSAANPIEAVVPGGGTASDGDVGRPPLATQDQRAGAAVATSLPMIALAVLLAWAVVRGLARSSDGDVTEPGAWPARLDAGRWSKLLALAVLLITVAVPIASLALSISPHRWRVDAEGRGIVARVLLWTGPSVRGSLLAAGVTGLLALLVALLASVRRASSLLLGVALLAFLVGGELLAIAKLRLYVRPAPWPLSGLAEGLGRNPMALVYNGLPILLLAYLGRFAWLPLLAARSAHARGLAELRELAAVDGAAPARAARSVVLPLVWPVLLASAVLVAILSLTEVGATVLLNPQRPQVLTTLLLGWVHMLRYDDMLEGSLLLMALAGALGLAMLGLMALGARLLRSIRSMAPALLLAALLLPGLTSCDRDGDGSRPEAVWFETGSDRGQLAYPRGIAYHAALDRFFVVDRTGRIQRFGPDGKVEVEWAMPESAEGKPVGLTVGPDGNLYVADTHYYRIMIFDPDGRLLRQFGSMGTGPGEFTWPMDVAFDAAGNVYVCETGGNDRIQVFSPAPEFKFLRQIGSFGQEPGKLARPVSLLIDGERLLVTDASNHRLQEFTLDGALVRVIGGLGSGLGQFRFPYGLARDSQGNLLVAEFGNNRVQVVDRVSGRGLRIIGRPGREEGQLAYPWAAVADARGRIVVVDSGNNRVQVFR